MKGWINIDVREDKYNGMNECAICDEPLIDAAINEIWRLRKIIQEMD